MTTPDKESFFDLYFKFVGKTEAPKLFNRWAMISAMGALLGRQFFLPFGHSKIYPNQFVFLVGVPGARKGTAINPIKNLLHEIKYKKLSPQRISPEMFLAKLQQSNTPQSIDYLTDLEIENLLVQQPSELYVVADELADFLRGNTDFVKVLTNLWDNLPFYDHPKLHGKSVYVHEPTISIFGGITPEDIMLSVPPETMGQGFFSRLILVYSEPTGIRLTIPPSPSSAITKELAERVQRIVENVRGEATIDPEAFILLDQIYKKFPGIDDAQFIHYNSRRFSHLLKLCLILAALEETTTVNCECVLKANTILHVTEQRMPKALGEFGKSRNASISHKIMELLKNSGRPLGVQTIWKHVVNDLNQKEDLVKILVGLEYAEKIQRSSLGEGKTGFLPKVKAVIKWQEDLLWTEKGFLFSEETV